MEINKKDNLNNKNKVIRKVSYKKYLFSFIISLGIFGLVFTTFSILNSERIKYLKDSQKNISKEISYIGINNNEFCNKIKESLLSQDFDNFQNNLQITKKGIGGGNKQVLELQKMITLLKIEYLNLVQVANKQCRLSLIPIIYIYSSDREVEDYESQIFILSYLSIKHSNLRIFYFNSSLNLPEIKTLKNRFKKNGINEGNLLIVGNKKYSEFMSKQILEQKIKELNAEIKIENTTNKN